MPTVPMDMTEELSGPLPGEPDAHLLCNAREAWGAAPGLVQALFTADLLLAGLYVLSRRLRHGLDGALVGFFDLDHEMNLPSWYSAVQLALIGTLLAAFAARFRRSARAAWALLVGGGIFLFLSLDEATSLHEHFGYWLDRFHGGRRGTLFDATGFWMAVCAPLFLAAIAAVGWFAWQCLRGRRAILVKLVLGVAVYVLAGAGIEILTNFIPGRETTAARVQVLFEETGEMLGATIILWGTLELLAAHGVRLLAVRDDADEDRSRFHGRA